MAPKLLIAAAALLAAAAPVTAMHQADRLPAHARHGALYARLRAEQRQETAELAAHLSLPAGWQPNATALWLTQPLDHFSNATGGGTFRQRYFFDTTFCGSKCFDPATPVVCEINGEWTATGAPGGAMAELASRLSAVMCGTEHRWYGESLPAPLSNKAAMMSSLTVEQAIEDFANFVPVFEALLNNGGAPPTGPQPVYTAGWKPARKWTIVGGSYAGALVSWITVRHGDLLAATWASSGVVNAIFNYTAFDETVAAALGPDCSAAVRATTAAFEAYWGDATKGPAMRAMFGVPAADPTFMSQTDFAWMLADAVAMGAQYGSKDALCAALGSAARATPSSPPPANASNFLTGWDSLVALANWTNIHYGDGVMGSSCYYSTKCLSNNSYSGNWSDSTTWVWECCNQLAYWQAAPPSGSLRSALITTDYYVAQCKSAYGPSVFADTAAFNARYGGALPLVAATSKVFATQGSDDPWQPAGVQAPISANYQEATAVCDGCSHCRDLHASSPSDPPALTAVRAAAINAIVGWVGPASSGPLSGGAIAGIVVGGIAVLAAAAFVVRCVRRRSLSARARQQAAAASSDSFYVPVAQQGY